MKIITKLLSFSIFVLLITCILKKTFCFPKKVIIVSVHILNFQGDTISMLGSIFVDT